MKSRLIFALLGSLLVFNVHAADDTAEGEVAGNGTASESTSSHMQTSNFFGSMGWTDGAGHVKPGETVAIQPLNPNFWMKFVDPKSHSKMHMAFTNPATYMQMMQPQFMMQFMNPANYMAMMNPQAFTVMMDPATWSYWMTPDAYMHGMHMSSYMQMMNPEAYTEIMDPSLLSQWMNPSSYTFTMQGAQ